MAETVPGIPLFVTLQEQLLDTKDPRDAAQAEVLAGMLESRRGQDIVYNPTYDVASPYALVDKRVEDLYAKVFPQISLPEEHRRQSLINARRYASVLCMGQDEYIATLPQFPEKPGIYDQLGLTVPVIAENRRPWLELAELSDVSVSNYLRARQAEGAVEDWKEDGFQVSQYPVISMWVQDGSRFINRKPQDVRGELLGNSTYREHYRAGRIPMSIALWNVRPDMMRTVFWYLIGTSVGSDRYVYLDRWDSQVLLDALDLGGADPDFRGFVFGSHTETLSLAA